MINFVECKRGYVLIHGVIGYRRYYGYTKKESIEKYKEEASKEVFYNMK